MRRLEYDGAAGGNLGLEFDTLIIGEIMSVDASVKTSALAPKLLGLGDITVV